jgi:hypothetical protein
MKAYTAKDIAYRANKAAKGVLDIDKLIEEAARQGKFQITLLVHHSWGDAFDLVEFYKSQGYGADHSNKQTSPNDSDDFIHLSWK